MADSVTMYVLEFLDESDNGSPGLYWKNGHKTSLMFCFMAVSYVGIFH